jgi:prepilin-type N-terminal cleavage/methylation domain-containing protein
MRGEKGFTLIETIVSVAILGCIGVAFLGGLATSSRSRALADEHVTSRILAESQMEDIRNLDYSPSYDPSPIPPEYLDYDVDINTESMHNGYLQKITISVSHHDINVFTLEGYKVDRE